MPRSILWTCLWWFSPSGKYSDTYGVIPTHHLNNFLWQRDEFPPRHHEFWQPPETKLFTPKTHPSYHEQSFTFLLSPFRFQWKTTQMENVFATTREIIATSSEAVLKGGEEKFTTTRTSILWTAKTANSHVTFSKFRRESNVCDLHSRKLMMRIV